MANVSSDSWSGGDVVSLLDNLSDSRLVGRPPERVDAATLGRTEVTDHFSGIGSAASSIKRSSDRTFWCEKKTGTLIPDRAVLTEYSGFDRSSVCLLSVRLYEPNGGKQSRQATFTTESNDVYRHK